MPTPLVDVTGLGENAVDIVLRLRQFPAPDGKVEIHSVTTRLGGQIATALAAIRMWGLKVRYIGSAGDDSSAELHAKEFARLGAEVHLRTIRHTPSRLSYILVNEASATRGVLWRRDRKLLLRPSDLKKEWIVRSKLLLIDGENPLASQRAAQWARSAGTSVVCDFDTATTDADMLLHDVDYPVLSSALTQYLAESPDYLTALPLLMQRYKSRLICTTLSEQGALAWDGESFWYAPAYRVHAVDTTGAGDLFHAGFTFGLLQGWGWQRIMHFACAAAGLNCTAQGARGRIGSVRTIEALSRSRSRNLPLYSARELKRAAEHARHLRS
ncbi:MAG TPA: carbohydrate kinase family protein [Candidatus Acidoferrum sp.]|nr:carbohydrate kinase family protein [Candidatus Acidoferrum sp.]